LLKKQRGLSLLALLVLAVTHSGAGSNQGGQSAVYRHTWISRLSTSGRSAGVGWLSVNGYGQNNGQGGESVFHSKGFNKEENLGVCGYLMKQKCDY